MSLQNKIVRNAYKLVIGRFLAKWTNVIVKKTVWKRSLAAWKASTGVSFVTNAT